MMAKLKQELEKREELVTHKARELHEQALLRTKAHLERVQQVVEAQKDKLSKEIEKMKEEIETKLQKAEKNRAEILEKVVHHAHELGMKKTVSHEVAPKAD